MHSACPVLSLSSSVINLRKECKEATTQHLYLVQIVTGRIIKVVCLHAACGHQLTEQHNDLYSHQCHLVVTADQQLSRKVAYTLGNSWGGSIHGRREIGIFIATAFVTTSTLCDRAVIQPFIFLVAVASSKINVDGLDAI